MVRFVGALIVAAVVPVLSGALYVAVPMLRSPEAVVNEQVDEHIETARRYLLQYRQKEDQLARLLHQLEAGGVDVTLADERIDSLLENDRSILDSAQERLKNESRGPAAARRRELEDRYRAAGGAAGQTAPPAGFGRNLPAMARALRQAVKARDTLLAENEKLIDQALAEINQALAVTQGDASGSAHPYANRLKGIILMARARVLQRKARRLRSIADERGERLVDLAGRAVQLDVEQRIVERSEIRRRIKDLENDANDLRSRIRQTKARINEMDDTMRDLEGRIQRITEHATLAREAMDRLADEGVNLLDADGSERFAREYAELSDEYRTALVRAHELEYGMLQGARIDDSGDYLHGAFVPTVPSGRITPKRGLIDIRHDRETAATDLEGYTDALAAVEASLEDLNNLAEEYADRVADAIDQMDRVRSEAAEVYAEFAKNAEQADALMGQVADQVRDGLTAFGAASMTSSNRARDAGDRLAAASQTRQAHSPFKQRSEARWLTGQIDNEVAQARYLLADILHQRYEAAAVDHERAIRARDLLGLSQADPEVFAERRDLAKEEGIRAIRQGIAGFEKSSRELDNNWTVAAQNGGAHYLLSLLENASHIQTAIENYAAAVEGREDQPFSQPIVRRLEQLRNR